uniref:Uncharacterized protein n=1 Tax=mine drainage metagenome TaxID=410659 RepID=E6QBH7_9ZZZZ
MLWGPCDILDERTGLVYHRFRDIKKDGPKVRLIAAKQPLQNHFKLSTAALGRQCAKSCWAIPHLRMGWALAPRHGM